MTATTIQVKAFEEPTQAELKELSELWHTSKVHSHQRYDRMLYVARWFHKAHPERSETSAYKALDRMLAGCYV